MADADLTTRIPSLLTEMDAEHRRVFDGIAGLVVIPQERFGTAYAALVAEIEDGFRQEEQIMDLVGYANIKAHRKDHAELLALLHRLRPYLEEGNTPLVDIVMGMIPAMLIRHMSGLDQELALALRQHAMPPQVAANDACPSGAQASSATAEAAST